MNNLKELINKEVEVYEKKLRQVIALLEETLVSDPSFADTLRLSSDLTRCRLEADFFIKQIEEMEQTDNEREGE